MIDQERMARLERQNAWMRRAGGVALAAAAVAALVGQGKPKEPPDLAVRSLAVKDAQGVTRLKLGTTDAGSPFIALADPKGAALATLGLDRDGSPALFGTKGEVVWRAPRPRGLRPGEESRVRTKCKEYYDTAKVWRMIKKRYPATLEEMEAPLRPGEADFVTLEDDPWGNRYVLEGEGRGIRVVSWGPDGIRGTADDIRYPPE